MKYNYTGASLKELKDKYGTGPSGFYPQTWYGSESFLTGKPEAGIYEINLGEDLKNLSYKEQVEKLKDGFTPIHPAILVEYILSHYAETKERLLDDKWARTSSVDSGGNRVDVGDFGSRGLDVYSYSDDIRYGNLGLSSARKFNKKIDALKLEPSENLGLMKRVKILEDKMKKIEKVIKF